LYWVVIIVEFMYQEDKFDERNFSKIKVQFVPKGKTIKVKRFKEGHIPEVTEFDFAVVDFGSVFKSIQDKSIPVKRRITKSNHQIKILSAENSKIKYAMLKVTRLANLPKEPYKDPKKRFQYQESLSKVCQPMVDEIYKEGTEGALALLMERGAILIGAFYNFPVQQIARVVAKRLDKADGTFGLGLSDLRLPPHMERFTKLHIQEDCIASGDSIGGLVLVLKEKGIFFEEIQIDCPAATQFGVEFLTQFLAWLGVEKVTFKVGALVYALDEHYYLRRTEDEGFENEEFVVGDMGEWSKRLPRSYNAKAWWNKNRLD
jgi:hypothetical protein